MKDALRTMKGFNPRFPLLPYKLTWNPKQGPIPRKQILRTWSVLRFHVDVQECSPSKSVAFPSLSHIAP